MAWWKTAKPGDPVVCVEGYAVNQFGDKNLIKGGLYTVRDIFPNSADPTEILIRVKEVTLIDNGYGRELGFPISRFRPAETTDLPASILECLNTPVPVKEKV